MKLSTEVKIEAGAAPAAGFEDITVKDAPGQEATFLSSIAAARQEAQTLFELSQDLGASLSLGETLSVFSVKLRRLVPYDAIAIYVKRDAGTDSGTGERRQSPPVLFAAHSAGAAAFRAGWRRTESRSSTAIHRSSPDI